MQPEQAQPLSEQEAGQLLDEAMDRVNQWRESQGLPPVTWAPDEEPPQD